MAAGKRNQQRQAATRVAGPNRRWNLALLGLPLAAVALCYANSLWGDFVWDDRRLILDDRAITSWRRLGEIFGHDFFYRSEDDLPYGYYRPLVTLSYLIDYSVWGLRPFGYHLTNLLLHSACSVLVGLLTVELGWSRIVALFAALLFAVHPIHTENVAWIAGRTDVVAFLFAALAFYALLRVDRLQRGIAPPDSQTHQLSSSGRPSLLLAIASFGAAMLAKEMSVVAIAWGVIALRYLRQRSWRATVSTVAPLLAVFAVYAIIRFGVLAVDVPGQTSEHSLILAALSIPSTLLRYLVWLAWPYPLVAYVQNPYVTSLTDVRLWLALAALVGAGWWLGGATRQTKVLAALLLAAFLPVLNLIRLAGPSDMGNLMAERFCYFPSFPFVVAVAFGAERLAAGWMVRRSGALLALAGVVLSTLAVITVRRNRDWSDELTFLRVSLAQTPSAVLLWGNLAQHQIGLRNLRDADESITRIEQLKPGSYAALSNRAAYYAMTNRLAEAIPLQEQVVKSSKRGTVTARNNLAYLYRKTGDSQHAVAVLNRLVEKGSGYSDIYFNLAAIYRERGDLDRARHNLQLALDDRPNSRPVAAELATLEMEQGNFEAAEAIYRASLSLYPDDVGLMNNLALVYHKRGDALAALELWRRAVALDPTYQNAQDNYRQALAQQK